MYYSINALCVSALWYTYNVRAIHCSNLAWLAESKLFSWVAVVDQNVQFYLPSADWAGKFSTNSCIYMYCCYPCTFRLSLELTCTCMYTLWPWGRQVGRGVYLIYMCHLLWQWYSVHSESMLLWVCNPRHGSLLGRPSIVIQFVM